VPVIVFTLLGIVWWIHPLAAGQYYAHPRNNWHT